MGIFCTSFFLQFKLCELKRGVFLGVTILNQLPRDINWHTCSHLPFYYLTSEPIKLQFAWFVFIIQQLLLPPNVPHEVGTTKPEPTLLGHISCVDALTGASTPRFVAALYGEGSLRCLRGEKMSGTCLGPCGQCAAVSGSDQAWLH